MRGKASAGGAVRVRRREVMLATAVAVGLTLLMLVAMPDGAGAQTTPSTTDPALEPVTVAGCGGTPVTMKRREHEVLRLHNDHRAQKGLPLLCVDAALQRAAQKHSTDMATRNFFSHTNPDGTPFYSRINAEFANDCYDGSAENIAAVWADTQPTGVFRNWLDSAGHRANIEKAGMVRIGVGSADDDDFSEWYHGDPYWGGGIQYTVDFAGKACAPNPPPVDDGGDPGDGGGTDPAVNRSAPTISGVRPAAGAKVRDATPRFSATVKDSQTDLVKSDVKVYIDGTRTYRFSYSPASDSLSGVSRKLKAGQRHSIRIVASDGEGKTSSKTTSFTVR